jgi:hypothetical protein
MRRFLILILALLIPLFAACESKGDSDPAADAAADAACDVAADTDAACDAASDSDTVGPDANVTPDGDAGPGTPGGEDPDVVNPPHDGGDDGAIVLGCLTNDDCAEGEICEPVSGVCLSESGCQDQCDLGDVDCKGKVARACVNGFSGCTEFTETDCALQMKSCFAGLCIDGGPESDCKSDLDCALGETCKDGDCVGEATGCTSALDCLDGQICVGGVCTTEGGGGDDSCWGICGGQADSGCWCDSQCTQFGDCCVDYGPACDNCEPSCDGKECGSDGCGGSCGSCEGNVNGLTVCDPSTYTCADPASFPGNVCEAAVTVDALPFQYASTTEVLSNSYSFSAGKCPGETAGMGGASSDQTFSLTSAMAGIYTVSVDADYDAALYAVTDCANVDGTCLAGVDDWSDESFKIFVGSGDTVFIIVDGYSNTSNGSGTFTLTVSEPCLPSCDGKVCGDDGCGTVCGLCNPADPDGKVSCDDATSQCVVPVGGEGGYCASALLISGTDLPYEVQGSTQGLGNFFSVDGTQCEGISSGKGGASQDAVYTFTPEDTGVYTISLDASFDSLLVISESCEDVNGSCLEASDGLGVEEIKVLLDGGGKYTIVVDGWSNSSDLNGTYTLSIGAPCIPTCDGKACGDNGCGGVCGACAPDDPSAPTVCDATSFQCVDPSTVSGANCANPIPVGALPFSSSGNTSGITNDFQFSAGACAGETGAMGGGSADLVYRFTAEVAGIYDLQLDTSFDAVLYAASDCAAIDGTCLAASDNGNPESLSVELTAGEMIYLFVDGYSSTNNQTGEYTLSIAEPCIPTCAGKSCGSNGCDGVCGTCDGLDPQGKTLCDDAIGECVSPASIEGNTCDNPISIPTDALPVDIEGDTTFMSNEYASSATGCDGWSSYGSASADSAYRFTAPALGYYTFTLVAEFDSAIYVVNDCEDIDNTCLGQDDLGTGSAEEVIALLDEGETVYVIVDGYSSFSDLKGAYTLSVSAPCTPSCDGKQCGTDGCGGVCAECAEGEACFEFQCVDPATLDGDNCGNAIAVGDLPWITSGDSSYYGPDYGYSANACPGESSAWGSGSKDVAYRFTAPANGSFTFDLDATFDSNLYAVEDCGNVDGTCLGANEEFGPETLTLELTSGQTIYIIVDGYGTTSNQSGPYEFSVTQN